MLYNGTAIKRAERLVTSCYVEIARSQTVGLDVTRREHRAHPGTLAVRQLADHGAGGYAVPRRAERDGGALFAVQIQVLLSITRVAVQSC
jgi:hypothetical protein